MIIKANEMKIWEFSQDTWPNFSDVPFDEELTHRFDTWIAEGHTSGLAEIAEYWGFDKVARDLELKQKEVKNGRKWFALGINGHVTDRYHFEDYQEMLEHIMEQCLEADNDD